MDHHCLLDPMKSSSHLLGDCQNSNFGKHCTNGISRNITGLTNGPKMAFTLSGRGCILGFYSSARIHITLHMFQYWVLERTPGPYIDCWLTACLMGLKSHASQTWNKIGAGLHLLDEAVLLFPIWASFSVKY